MNTPSLTPTLPLEQQPVVGLVAQLVGQPAAESLFRAYGTLSEMARGNETEIASLARITARRARQIKAALLLAQKLTHECQPEKPLLDCPEKIADLLREENRAYKVECFQLVLLNTRKRLIRVEKISQGTLDTILVHPREVFRPAILASAAAVAFVHNLCVAAHKLCYVALPVMCSVRFAGLAILRHSARRECHGFA